MAADPHSCDAFSRHLSQVLLEDLPLGRDELAGARACERCRGTLAALTRVLAAAPETAQLDPVREAGTVEAAQGAARRSWRLGTLVKLALGLFTSGLLLLALQWGPYLSGTGREDGTFVLARVLFVTVATGWLVWLGIVSRPRAGRPDRLYRRWKGLQVEGVCAGLGEYLGISPWVPRVVFLALLLGGLGGGSIYVCAMFALDFAPEDREHLLEFRLRRWLSRWSRSPQAQRG